MVKNWQKQKLLRKKFDLNLDEPPVIALETSSLHLPDNKYLNISFFRTPKIHENSYLNTYFSDKTHETLVLYVSTHMQQENCQAFLRLANKTWIDYLEIITQPKAKSISLQPYFDLLNNEISRIGGSNFYFDFYAYVVSQTDKTISFFTNCPESVVRIRGTSSETLKASAKAKSANLEFTWKLGRTKAIVFADPCPTGDLETLAAKLSVLTYPTCGAAELLHFDLQRHGKHSNVIWTELY